MLKVLFAASEATPMAKVGGLADVVGALPKALKELGVDVRVIIPKYRPIETPGFLPGSKVPVYYVESKEYFDRDQIYGYKDDQDRFTFFSKALLEYTKKIGFEPDIIHINDYHTSLVPVLLKAEYNRDPFFAQVRTILTIHNLANQGIEDLHVLAEVGLKGDSTPNLAQDSRDGDVDLLMEGIEEAGLIVAVSPTYAKEILTPEYGEKLDPILQKRPDRLFGVLNGIDVDVYNPEIDPNLVSKFSLSSLDKRAANKAALVKDFKFDEPDLPIVGMVTRLVSQKGFDILLEIGDQLGQLPLNFIILGLGEKNYEEGLQGLAAKYSNIKIDLEFNEGKSRQIYAGSDFFLIPSRFEPCGLTQMIAMRYGSVPIVRKTGGLADTVTEGRTGIVFTPYKSDSLMEALKEAIELYQDKKSLTEIQERDMRQDFSWDKSAKEYVNLYQKVLQLPKESS
jgi:starch synthase